MRTRIGWLCVVGAIAVASASACRQIAGISDSPPEALTSTLCGLPYGTNTCAACASKSCCAESMACAADDACAAYEGCLGACNGDAACRSQCNVDHPAGVATDVIGLSTCLASHCETACGLTCGGVADLVSPPSAARACAQCMTMNTCTQAEACASSAACTGDLRAQSAFATIDSAEVYEANLCAGNAATGLSLDIDGLAYVCGSHPGVDTDASVSQTAGYFWRDCSSACAIGNDWTCSGHVNWPPPKAPTCTIGYRVTDYLTSAPVSGALLQVCSPDDGSCQEPLAHGMTDDSGTRTLQVPNTPSLASQGLNGFTRITGPDLLTSNVYWGFPLVEGSLPVWQTEIVTLAENKELLAETQVNQSDGLGQLTVWVIDCLYQTASGVTVTLNGDPSKKGMSTKGVATTTTDATGLIFFSNVPPGAVTITATPSGLDRPAAETRVYVNPGEVTIAYMFKMPSPSQ
jgi:hypothetical protein